MTTSASLPAVAASSERQPRILVVEDSATQAAALAALLEARGLRAAGRAASRTRARSDVGGARRSRAERCAHARDRWLWTVPPHQAGAGVGGDTLVLLTSLTDPWRSFAVSSRAGLLRHRAVRSARCSRASGSSWSARMLRSSSTRGRSPSICSAHLSRSRQPRTDSRVPRVELLRSRRTSEAVRDAERRARLSRRRWSSSGPRSTCTACCAIWLG